MLPGNPPQVVEPRAIVHVTNRAVRRCFLLGDDPVTGKNFDHRKRWPLSSEISNTAARTPQRLRLPRQSTRQAPVRPPSRQLSWQVPDVRHVLVVRTGETVSGRVPAEGQNVACMASQVCQRNRIAAIDANLVIR